MNLDDYSLSGEKVECQTDVRSTDSTGDSGTLGCTNRRVVFVSGERITDISLDSITSIEYQPPSYLNWATVLGGLLSLASLVLFRAELPIGELAAPFASTVFAITFIIVGIFIAQAKIKIRTANTTHTFRSRDSKTLKEFPTAIRTVR